MVNFSAFDTLAPMCYNNSQLCMSSITNNFSMILSVMYATVFDDKQC